MKYLYLKGMSASQDELDYIKSKFQKTVSRVKSNKQRVSMKGAE